MDEEKRLVDLLTVDEVYEITQQLEREKVAPRFDEWRKPYQYKIAYGGRGAGAKCLKKGTLVWMFDGTVKAIEKIQQGELVMGMDSTPRKVISTTKGYGKLYKVSQCHAMDYVVNEEHILTLKKSVSCAKQKGEFKKYGYRRPNGTYPKWNDITDISINEYLKQSARWKDNFNGLKCETIQYPEKAIPVPAYIIGAWLGDGNSTDIGITSMDNEIVKEFREWAFSLDLKEHIYEKTNKPNKAKTYVYTMGNNGGKLKNKAWDIFRELHLIKNKHIPQIYLSNSETNRLELLAGLIDTDGSLRDNKSGYVFSQSKEHLARQVKQLADSLGFRTSLNKRKVSCNGKVCDYWAMTISGDIYRVPCRLARKKIEKDDFSRKSDWHVTKINVEEYGYGEYAGIAIDGDNRFLLEDGTVTHNSWSAESLLIQFGEHPDYFGENIRVVCSRYVQNSIEESCKELLSKTIKRLKYKGWKETKTYLENTKNGSLFFFKGLNDIVADNFKGLESIDILFVEEAAKVEKNAWKVVLPSMRKKGSEVWALFNRDKQMDPVYELFVRNPRPKSCILDLKPGPIDNPWWNQSELPSLMAADYAEDPDEAAHIWEGLPRAQSDKAVFQRVKILAMKDREASKEGSKQIGCDVARFGKDSTQAYMKQGFQVIKHESCRGYDTVAVANMLWEMAEHNASIPILVDSGYNPGVIDVLKTYGANVTAIGFGESAVVPEKYPNSATEMYFDLPVEQIGIPAEWFTQTLLEDLTERLFYYDNAGRKRIEPKDGTTVTENGTSKQNFKARHGGRSPDEGDALMLAFYNRVPNWTLL